MRLITLGSSSKGNCYILQDQNNQSLILDCGVNINHVKQSLGFDFTKVAGCLLTHEHGDHSKSISELMALSVNVYTSKGTQEALGYKNNRFKTIRSGESFQLGPYKIIPFEIKHDCKEPLGFYINHAECGNVLFITDSYFVKNTFKNLNNIIIEANYSQEILQNRVSKGMAPSFLMDRVFTSHMSIETTIKTLKANDLSKVRNIVLIHLSDGNSNAAEFTNMVQRATGKSVHVADAGLIIENFNKNAF